MIFNSCVPFFDLTSRCSLTHLWQMISQVVRPSVVPSLHDHQAKRVLTDAPKPGTNPTNGICCTIQCATSQWFWAMTPVWISWVISHVPIFHITQPLDSMRYFWSTRWLLFWVMSNIPKMGHLTTPVWIYWWRACLRLLMHAYHPLVCHDCIWYFLNIGRIPIG